MCLNCIANSNFCQGGVQRVHLLDGTISGVLLLELFKRDGMGTMVARYAFINPSGIDFTRLCKNMI